MNQAVLYSKDNCQWCERVKQLFAAVNIEYIEYKYERDFDRFDVEVLIPLDLRLYKAI